MSKQPPLTDESGEVRELTAGDFALMRPLSEADPDFITAIKASRNKGGRPKLEKPKVHVGFRLAADVVDGIKATGDGYNARVESVLREALAAGKLDAPNDLVGGADDPDAHILSSWNFIFPEDPDFSNINAFDFVIAEFNARVKADGASNAQIARSVLVERAIAKELTRHEIELAITYQIMAGALVDKDGVLRFAHEHGVRDLPSSQLRAYRGHHVQRKPERARVHPVVKDIIERRTDARPLQIEPLDSFADELEKLGYGAFRLWWAQTVRELKQTDTNAAPVSTLVLAAALVEGALTFIVKHARSHGAFKSTDYDKDPHKWKIENLVASAASGGPDAIFDQQTKNRAETLIRARQRIHAGRMLPDFPSGVPDIRPEEARNAKGTADQAIRCVLDWLQKFPATTGR